MTAWRGLAEYICWWFGQRLSHCLGVISPSTGQVVRKPTWRALVVALIHILHDVHAQNRKIDALADAMLERSVPGWRHICTITIEPVYFSFWPARIMSWRVIIVHHNGRKRTYCPSAESLARVFRIMNEYAKRYCSLPVEPDPSYVRISALADARELLGGKEWMDEA